MNSILPFGQFDLDRPIPKVRKLFKSHLPEAAFAETMTHMRSWSKSLKDGSIFRWNGSFHQRLEDSDVEEIAYNLILDQLPGMVTARIARAAREACLLRLPALPPPPMHRIIIAGEDLWLEVMPNGVIFRRKPDMSIGITSGIPIKFGGNAGEIYKPAPELPSTSMLDKFLKTVQPDVIARNFLRDWAGYTLIPSDFLNLEKCLICLGDGGDGKSAAMSIIASLHSNFCSIRPDELNAFGLQPITKLPTLICIDEVPSKPIETGLWKSLISGGVMAVDRKNKAQVNVNNIGRVIMCGNKPPRLSETMGPAFQRRHVFLKFNAAIPQDQMEPNLAQKIISREMSLIVDWALNGISAVLTRGIGNNFVLPASTEAITHESLSENDSCYAWTLLTQPILHPDAKVSKVQTYSDYCDFCNELGRKPMSAESFWRSLRRHLRCDSAALEAGQTIDTRGTRVRHVHLIYKNSRDLPIESQECPF
jgi:putative DNA primase/helicase